MKPEKIRKLKSLTKINSKLGWTRKLVIEQQARFIFENYIEITGNPKDRIVMPMVFAIVTFLSNPGYYKNFIRFQNQVTQEIHSLLLANGAEKKTMCMKDRFKKRNPWYKGHSFYQQYGPEFDENFITQSSKYVVGFWGAKINWPYIIKK